MSSAILYLAIIAIWACVLVPRWIHKPHRVPEADELPGLKYVSASGPSASGTGRAASASGNAPPAAWAAASTATVSTAAPSAAAPSAAAPGAPTASAPTASTDADAGAGTGAAGGGTAAAGAGNARAGKASAAEVRPATADSAAAAPTVVEEGVAWHRVTRSYHSEHQAAQRPQSQPAPGRAHVLQARRRLLTTLVMLATVALAGTAANLTPWWILLPPVGMLGVYLLLLREAAQADAEQARWLAQERADQAEAARLPARRTGEASQRQPTAEIIDISARVTDQLYDQYADAAVRAVGD